MPAADLTPYYQPSGTVADGTKFDNALAYLQGLLNGLDQNNFAAGKIFDPEKLMQNSAADADALVWDNTSSKWVRSSSATRLRPPGYEFAYTEFTGTVSVTAVSEGTANQAVAASAVTFDGSTVVVLEFWCPYVLIGGGSPSIEFFDGSTGIGGILTLSANAVGFSLKKRITPSAAAHTYSVKGWTTAGTATIGAGTGAAAAALPGFIRITKA